MGFALIKKKSITANVVCSFNKKKVVVKRIFPVSRYNNANNAVCWKSSVLSHKLSASSTSMATKPWPKSLFFNLHGNEKRCEETLSSNVCNAESIVFRQKGALSGQLCVVIHLFARVSSFLKSLSWQNKEVIEQTLKPWQSDPCFFHFKTIEISYVEAKLEKNVPANFFKNLTDFCIFNQAYHSKCSNSVSYCI